MSVRGGKLSAYSFQFYIELNRNHYHVCVLCFLESMCYIDFSLYITESLEMLAQSLRPHYSIVT